MRYNDGMKHTYRTEWIMDILGIFIIGSYIWGNDIGNYISRFIYEAFTGFYIVSLLGFIGFMSDDMSVLKLLMGAINSPKIKLEAEKEMGKGTFFNLFQVIHILMGIYFIVVIRDKYLITAFIGMMFYFRFTYLVLRAAIVRYLNHLDLQGY